MLRIALLSLLLVPALVVGVTAQGVVINEIVTDGNDYCELANLSTSAVNVGGWTLYLYDDPSAILAFTFPLGTMLQPNELLVVSENPSSPIAPPGVQVFDTSNINWAVNSGAAVALNDGNGNPIDFVRVFNATNLPPVALAPFSGSVPTGGGTNTLDVLARNSSVDTDTDLDFTMTASGTDTPGLLNPGQSPVMLAVPTADFVTATLFVMPGTTVTFYDRSLGLPTSWAWDLDGNGSTDSTVRNPTFTYNASGTFVVTLTATNGLGSDSVTQTMLVSGSSIPATVPYSNSFDSGPLGPEWELTSTATGQILVQPSGLPSPVSGGNTIRMDSFAASSFSINDAILHLDFAASGGGVLRYWFRQSGDENDPDDGVFISDGVTTVQAVSHNNLSTLWQQITVDLTAVALTNGLTLASDFRVSFRQADNSPFPSDGVEIDDVEILPPFVADTGQANQANARFDIVGARNLNDQAAAIGVAGPFFVTEGTIQLTVAGQPNQPYILLFGPLNRDNAVFSGIGSLDIGLMGPTGFADLGIVLNGTAGGLLNSLAFTGPSGASNLTFGLGPVPPGLFGTMQAIVFTGGTSVVALSAAIEITKP